MDSKILFKNKTSYTPEIAHEAGEVFWQVQPAYKKKARTFRIAAGVLSVSFLVMSLIAIFSSGIGVMTLGGLAMAVIAAVACFKAESLVRGSAKNFQGLNTTVDYGISENFFFVLNREYPAERAKRRKDEDDGEEEYDEDDETAETDAAADEEDEEPIELAQSSPVTLMGMVAENGPGKMVRPKSIFSDDEEEEFHNEYEDEFLSLDDLLVCISSPEIFILIWEKPYYILDRKGFEEGRDEEFIEFIKEKAKYIEA